MLRLALGASPALAAGEAAQVAALQACPKVNHQVVDLDRLAEGLKNSSAVGLAARQAPARAPPESMLPHHVRVRHQALDYRAVCDTGRACRVWVGVGGQVMVPPLHDSARTGPEPRSAPPPASAPG